MAEPNAHASPVMQQYYDLKSRDPQALLLFRLGDFYEMFGADAIRSGELLGLTVTTRDRDKGPDAIPMSGFPHHQLEPYLEKLVKLGVRAAVCEQMESPKNAKGIVKRDIVRIVSAGTLTDEALLDPKTANYLASAVEVRGKLGLAWAELSTGRFSLTTTLRKEFADEIARLAPAELLVSETMLDAPWVSTVRGLAPNMAVTPRPSWDFLPDQARKVLHDHFRVSTLSGFGIDDQAIEVQAAGALLAYLRETQKTSLRHLCRLTPYIQGGVMRLDEMSRRSLELTRTLREGKRDGSLLHAIDRTATPMGARMLAEWLAAPTTDLKEIHRRQDAIAELTLDAPLTDHLRSVLGQISDLERLAGRISAGRATPRDMVALAKTLAMIPSVKSAMAQRASTIFRELGPSLDDCPEVRQAIEDALTEDPPLALKDGGLIREGFHALLDELREAARGGKTWIAKYQAEQIRRTGISTLKVGYNKVTGYYIEITHANQSRVPSDYIRKWTVKNAERYITPELKEYEDKVRGAEDKSCELEYELFVALRDRVAAETPRLIQSGMALAQLDALAGLAELAAKQGYCRPEMVADPVFEVEGGRHPVLDVLMSSGQFTPNDTTMSPEDGLITLITGPNMAGKSTYIRQVALIAVMAQMGSFVPAKAARLGTVDRLFARVGATDELSRGQSTFMVEMTETANILNNATPRSLVILDEIGRGTSTFDGISLAWAITEHLHDQIGCRTLFATHYHELVDLEKTKPKLRNANVAVLEREGDIVFLHRIVPGGADQSYGIHVARLAGVPALVLDRAKEILAFLEREHAAQGDAGPSVSSGQETASTAPGAAPAIETKGAKPGPPVLKVKTGRSLQGSLFASLPDPLLEELRNLDLKTMTSEKAMDLVKRLKSLA